MANEIYKSKEPPQVAVKFANVVFILGGTFSVLIAVYAVYKIFNPSVTNTFYYLCFLFSGILVVSFVLGLRKLFSNKRKTKY